MEPVVTIEESIPGVALIRMQERTHKNTFSPALIDGLFAAFETVAATVQYKVAVLTGYDNYFSSGGTQDALISIYEGKSTFVNEHKGSFLYSLPLECPIPVIAAMQGHGTGAGFTLGLACDIAVLGRESYYTANYMKYGFTPGFGATYYLPKKLGVHLANEILFSGERMQGAELEKRGVPFAVVPRGEVVSYALERARELAEKPRLSLITLKKHLVAELREDLPGVIAEELAMHERTFHQTEVKERIMELYSRGIQ